MRLPLRSLLAVLIALTIAQVPTHVRAQKYTKYTVVPLVVTVESTLTGGADSAITPDEMGPDYTDGQDDVEANLDQWGNLIIDFAANPKRAPIRSLNYAYRPVDTNDAISVDDYNNLGDSYISTIKDTSANPVAIQDMKTGTSQCVKGAIARSGGVFYFGRPVGEYDNNDTSWLLVTRLNTEIPTWEIETRCDTQGVFGGVTRLLTTTTKGKSSLIDLGLYELPFRMTLTAKQ